MFIEIDMNVKMLVENNVVNTETIIMLLFALIKYITTGAQQKPGICIINANNSICQLKSAF